MGVAEWRHAGIDILRFPVGSALILETKRRKGPVIRATSGQTSSKQIRMSQQIRSHKRSIGVSTYTDSFWINDPLTRQIINGCSGVFFQLFDKSIIRLTSFATYDRHIGIVQNGIAPRSE